MSRTILGLLHPGEMGAAIGRCLTDRGHTVLWASRGRSPASAERAAAAGLTDTGTVPELARRAEVILSVCPPHAARSVAESAAAGLPDGFHLAAAEIFRRVPRADSATVDLVLGADRGPGPGRAHVLRLPLPADATS